MLALIAAWIGHGSVTHALAQSLRTRAVERAYALAPGDGQIAAALAEKRFGVGADLAARAQAERLARIALRADPTVVAAIGTLGFVAALGDDTTSARRLFAFSEKLSRRDLRTQLWLVEDAVARDDIRGALRHYDIALRTSKSAPELLYPVLASATVEPAIRAELVSTLAGKPAWAESFINYVSGNGPDPRATASLFNGLQRGGVVVGEAPQKAVVDGLLAANRLDVAWSFYASMRPGADRRFSRDPRFAHDLGNPSPFGWVPVNDAGITTSIQRGDEGGVLDFAAPPGVGGVLVRQTQMLPPGTYRLDGRSAGIDQPAASRLYWQLSCRDGQELGRVPLGNSAENGGAFTGRLVVPKGCPLQTLALVARPSDALVGTAGQIHEARLRPIV